MDWIAEIISFHSDHVILYAICMVHRNKEETENNAQATRPCEIESSFMFHVDVPAVRSFIHKSSKHSIADFREEKKRQHN